MGVNKGYSVLNLLGDAVWTINVPVVPPVGFTAVIQIDFTDSPYLTDWGEDLEVDCTAGDVEIDFPTAIGNNGQEIKITRIDGSLNDITLDPFGGETMLGEATLTIDTQWESRTVKSNGTTNVTWR